MPGPELATLPPELLHEIMGHLPVPALLALGATAHYLHAVQRVALTTLQLGAFPSRLDSVFSCLDGAATHAPNRYHAILLPKDDCHARDGVIRAQNSRIAEVLKQETHQKTLRDVELALWELDRGTAAAVAQLKQLRSLALRLDHPHTRHPKVDRAFWRQSPGSTVWNELYTPSRRRKPSSGSGTSSRSASPAASTTSDDPPAPVLGRLESLTLERAGITDYQLRRVLEDNPHLTELRLRRCHTLTAETFAFLASSPAVARRLRVLRFEHSDAPDVDARVLGYLAALPALETLSLRGCLNLTNAEVEAARREQAGAWREVVLPRPVEADPKVRIAVDPAYK